jgi:hypothetical protein
MSPVTKKDAIKADIAAAANTTDGWRSIKETFFLDETLGSVVGHIFLMR